MRFSKQGAVSKETKGSLPGIEPEFVNCVTPPHDGNYKDGAQC